jgi:hypothetical protein
MFAAAGLYGAALVGSGLLVGCETSDPCALRQAACVEITLVGKRDDGAGNPIAYRNLSVQIFAPNSSGPRNGVQDHCTVDMGAAVPHLYGTEMGPLGMALGTQAVPDLTLASTYAPAVQGKIAFQLPDSFNALPDTDPATTVDPLPDDTAKVNELQRLRDSDPRAIRILVTQSGQSHSAWDSRCDEAQFSTDEWEMKQYYRVGHNKAITVLSILEGAQTSTP